MTMIQILTLIREIATNMDKIGIYVVLLPFVIFSAYIIYKENRPEYDKRIINTGTVIKSGCVTHKYKGNNKYDCSAKILMEDGSEVLKVLKLGVIEGDVLPYVCKTSYHITGDTERCYFKRKL